MLYCDNYLQSTYLHSSHTHMDEYKISTNHLFVQAICISIQSIIIILEHYFTLIQTEIKANNRWKICKINIFFTYLSHRSVNFCFKIH